jgi:tetratricopeptide (TPR) repeat protein
VARAKQKARLWRAVALSAGGAAALYFCGVLLGFWPSLPGLSPIEAVEIQHPIAGAIMPLNMPAPVLLWRTNMPGVVQWAAVFKAGRKKWSFDGVAPMWRPAESDWRLIKEAAPGGVVEVGITGYEAGSRNNIKVHSSVRISIARESVQDALFYREVHLPFKEAVKDPSQIRWRFGGLDTGTIPPVVLEHLPVCGNCHSFSRDGSVLGMDVDYANDKGSYVITRTAPEMQLVTSDIITWNDFHPEDGHLTLGLLSQVSPDGRYAVSTVKDLSVFMAKPDLAFSQLFFPFLGVLGVYDRESKGFFSLPGADDPAYVQSNAAWSPDGRWIVFARSRAVEVKGARGSGRVLLEGAEGEEFLRQTRDYRYDLYRVPFNGGKGGKAEPLRGASGNGRSNYFPKYSPDGRWIIFCQAANYMLLQPDSQLFIIPAEGGEARRLGCNLSRMNSWHSWSSDGRWLVFSSKTHSDYTQLYLTRISQTGEASPPVWLAHLVAPRRAANIPEFVPLRADAITRINEHFVDDYSYVRAGDEFYRAGEPDHAMEKYRLALARNAENIRAHQQLGLLLLQSGHAREAMEHLEKGARLDPKNPVAQFHLGRGLLEEGKTPDAIVHLEEAARCMSSGHAPAIRAGDRKEPLSEALHVQLARAYHQIGNFTNAQIHYVEALRLDPSDPDLHYSYGSLLLRSELLAEAEARFTEAVQLRPSFAGAHNCLGIIRQRQNRLEEALACFQRAVQADANNWQAHLNLANMHLALGHRDQAISEFRETLRLEPSSEQARHALARAVGSPGSQ